MNDSPQLLPPERDPDVQIRLHHVDQIAYQVLFAAAASTLGTGSALIDQALAIWNPKDDDPAYNYVTGLEMSEDRDRAWELGLAAARSGGAHVFGIGMTPALEAWAPPDRLAAFGLTYAHDEIVWVARLAAAHATPVALPVDGEIQTEGFDPEHFARVLNRGWELADDHGRGLLYSATIGRPGWTHYLVRINRQPSAGAVLFHSDGVAICMVAATLPEFRNRGLQTVLISRRLADAVAAGCDLAMTETVADNASPRNFHRSGFVVLARRKLYSKTMR